MIPGLPLTSLKIPGASQEQSSLSDTINLKPGRIIDAKVIDVKPENRAQLVLSEKTETASGSGKVVRSQSQQMSGGGGTAASTSKINLNQSGKSLLAGQKVEVSTSMPLKSGMSLTLTTVATREGPVFKQTSATAQSSSHSQGSTGTVDAALKILPGKQNVSAMPDSGIKPGQTVEAKVLDVTSQNRVQLLVGGQKLTVSTQLPLTRGMDIPMKVVRSQDGIVLKPVSNQTAPVSTSTASTQSTTTASTPSTATSVSTATPAPSPVPTGTAEPVISPAREAAINDATSRVAIDPTRGAVVTSGRGDVIDSNTAAPDINSAKGAVVNTDRAMSSISVPLPDSSQLSGSEKSFQTTSAQSFSLSKIFLGLGALSQTKEPLLNDILMGLSLKSDIRDDQFLPKIIKNMGLSFENKLANALEDAGDKKTVAHVIEQLSDQDLKAASLSLSSTESEPAKASGLKYIADALDNFAQLNVKSGDSGQNQDSSRFLLPFPVWTDDGFDFGQLMVDMGKGSTSNTEKKMLSISFLLNMTAIGPLRADFSILDKTIAGRFLLENQETCDYLAPKISDLRQRLSSIGYQSGKIDCRVARPEQIAPASLMLSMKAPDDLQGLNIVV